MGGEQTIEITERSANSARVLHFLRVKVKVKVKKVKFGQGHSTPMEGQRSTMVSSIATRHSPDNPALRPCGVMEEKIVRFWIER